MLRSVIKYLLSHQGVSAIWDSLNLVSARTKGRDMAKDSGMLEVQTSNVLAVTQMVLIRRVKGVFMPSMTPARKGPSLGMMQIARQRSMFCGKSL